MNGAMKHKCIPHIGKFHRTSVVPKFIHNLGNASHDYVVRTENLTLVSLAAATSDGFNAAMAAESKR
jgi:hypothetical protein